MEVPYELVYKYLHSREYPENSDKNKKRAIRSKAKKFTIKDGVLFNSFGGRQWINCREKQQQIIESCHADKLGGHLGRDKTREKVTSRY